VISSGSPSNGYTATACLDTEKKQEVLAFMKAAELPAADIQVEEIPFDSSQLPDDMPTAIREHVIQELQGSKQLKVRFLLPDVETQESIVFRHDEISTGTCALFAWAGPWLDVEKNNCVLVVDELDSSLHPLLVQQLVQRMNHGKGQAQLICTTHDTSLLSAQHVLRRDQVWFVEKNPQTCAADLYPLSALSPRLGEAIQTRYLSGRYGGIPRIERWDDPPQED
jgi:AAA15 family ATPase/GTPase